MEDKPPFYSPIQEFLDIALIDSRYLYVDVWSFIHTLSGVILGTVLARWMRPVIALAKSEAMVRHMQAAGSAWRPLSAAQHP